MACNISSLCSLQSVTEFKETLNVSYVFQVVDTRCYLADKSYLIDHSLPPETIQLLLYDITVTDGRQKLVCHLNHQLGHMIQRLHIFPSSWIRVEEFHFEPSPKNSSYAFTVIDKLVPLIVDHSFSQLDALPYANLSSNDAVKELPLGVKREYFLEVWFNKVIDSRLWLKEPCLIEDVGKVSSKPLVTLDELANPWMPWTVPYPPIIVVVLLVSRINHFGKSNTDDLYPFQLYLEVADQSGTCTLLIWGKAIQRIYPFIKVGSHMVVYNFHIGRNHSPTTRPKIEVQESDLPHFDIELKYNEKPKGILRIISNTSANEPYTRNLPKPALNIVQAKDLSTLSEKAIVNVMGVILYVGRFEREKAKKENVDLEEYWVHRWIEIIDNTDPKPIRILTFISSQTEIHKQLCPGKIILYTHLQYVKAPGNSSVFYFTTTSYSQVYLEQNLPLFCLQNSHEELLGLGKMISDGHYTTFTPLQKFCRVGGKYPLIICETSLEDLKKYWLTKYSEDLPITNLEDLPLRISDLNYRECRQFYCTGFMTRTAILLESTEDIFSGHQYVWHYQHRNARLREFVTNTGGENSSTQQNLHYPQCINAFWSVKYVPEQKDTLLNWLSFPGNNSQTKNTFPKDIPRLCCSIYQVDLVNNLEQRKGVRCLFTPEPASQPDTPVMDLLAGNYESSMKDMGGILYSPLHYSKQETINILNVTTYSNVPFLFVINVYRCCGIGFEITLHRAFPFTSCDTEDSEDMDLAE